MTVSNMAKNLLGSEIIRLATEIKELQRTGSEICNLTIGDFDPAVYPIPAALKGHIIDAYEEGHTNYPGSSGIIELRNSISEFMFQQLGIAYSADEIQVSCGSRPLIYATYLAILDQDEKVLYPVPSWNNNHYCHMVGAHGLELTTFPENDFMPTAADVLPFLEEITLLALCSPLNPTGTMFSRKDLVEICELVLAENKRRGPNEKPLYILFDQVYWQITFGDKEHYTPVGLIPELKEYTIIIDGISKSYASTGVRVGWALGPEKIVAKIRAIMGHIGAWAPRAEQRATAKYLQEAEHVHEYMVEFKDKLLRSLNGIYNFFIDLKSQGYSVDAIEPMGAIYLTAKIDVSGKRTPEGDILITNKDISRYFLHEAGVGIVPFSAFGAREDQNWFRLSVGGVSEENILKAMPKIKLALDKLS